jgi:hypothetical protein
VPSARHCSAARLGVRSTKVQPRSPRQDSTTAGEQPVQCGEARYMLLGVPGEEGRARMHPRLSRCGTKTAQKVGSPHTVDRSGAAGKTAIVEDTDK